MAYIGSSPTKVVSRQSANIFTYTATANQTAFTGSDANGNTLACTPSDIMVHMNGLRLEESDFTATTTTVTLGSGAAVGDEVTITAFVTFETADAYTKSASDTRYVNAAGDNMTGNLTTTGNVGVGEASPNLGSSGTGLHIKGAASKDGVIKLDSQTADRSGIVQFTENGTDKWRIGYDAASNHLEFTRSGVADRMLISDDGYVTKPSQPSFSAYSTGEFNTTTNTNTTIRSLNGTYVNSGNHYATSGGTAGRFTAPVAGNYFFGFQLLLGAIATTDDAIHASFHKNGILDIYGNTRYDGAGANGNLGYSGYLPVIGVTMMPLAVNDYVELVLFATGSIAVHNSASWSRFYGYLLG